MIRIEGISLTVGSFALRDVSLRVEKGEYFVLLGPTGSGKTLLIECLCGLLRPSAGRIEIEGADVTGLEPRRRRVGYVPQHQALLPHLTVRDNIAFPLRARGAPLSEYRRLFIPAIDLLGLWHLLERWPAHLSGGERQKVALARALVVHPRLLVLDEPVSALDEAGREQLCAELRRVHAELGVTTIHISHSVEEALSVADRAGVVHQGRLLQVGPVAELLRRPASEFVARFFRTENIIPAEASPAAEGTSELRFGGHCIAMPGRHHGSVVFVVRPETLVVHPADADVPNAVPAVLRRVTDRGPYSRLELDAGLPLVAYVVANPGTVLPAIGHTCLVAFAPEAIHVIP